MDSWLAHGDEAVAAAALDKFAKGRLSHWQRMVVEERIEASRGAEPGVWTPLLDRAREASLFLDTEEEMKAMGRWFRQAGAREAEEILKQVHSEVPGFVAAKECREWSVELVGAIIDGSQRAWPRLGRNPRIQDEAVIEHLFFELLDRLKEGRHTYGPQAVMGGLENLVRRGATLPDSAQSQLLRLVRSEHISIAGAAARALGAWPNLDDDIGHQVVSMAADRSKVVAEFLKGKGCSAEVAKAALLAVPRLPVRRAIIKRKELLGDPEIRSVLAESECARVMTALIATGSPEEGAKLLRTICQTNPDRALEVIEDHLPAGTSVPSDALAALLESPNAAHRERALKAVGKLKPRSVPTETSDPGRRRR